MIRKCSVRIPRLAKIDLAGWPCSWVNVSLGDLRTVTSKIRSEKEGIYVQMGRLGWLNNLVISWRHRSEVPGLAYGNRGSVRGTD